MKNWLFYSIMFILLVGLFMIGYFAGYTHGQKSEQPYENTLVQIIKEYRDKYGSLDILK